MSHDKNVFACLVPHLSDALDKSICQINVKLITIVGVMRLKLPGFPRYISPGEFT